MCACKSISWNKKNPTYTTKHLHISNPGTKMNWGAITTFFLFSLAFSSAVAFFVIAAITLNTFNTPGDCTLDISFSGLEKEETVSMSSVQLFFELDEYRLELKNAFVGTAIGNCFDFCEDSLHTCTNPALSSKVCYKSCIACRDHDVLNSGTENCITNGCARFNF